MGIINNMRAVRSRNAKKQAKAKAAKKSKYDGTNIAYTRRGSNTVFVNADGAVVKKKVKTVWVTDKKGNKYEIPVDKDGHVPKDAIWSRFLDVDSGTRSGHARNVAVDVAKDATLQYEPIDGKGFTPQELVDNGWWPYPNSCDLMGFDDTGGLVTAAEIPGVPKMAMNVGKRIAILLPEKEAERARQILAQNFTGSELKKAVKNGGIVITDGNPGKGAAGCHYGLQPGVDTPVIIVRPGFTEETLTHEFIHHLRQVDATRGGIARTPFRLDDNNYLVPSFFSTKESKSARNLEEAATVSESYIRTHEYKGANGYFRDAKVSARTPSERGVHDRQVYNGAPGSERYERGNKAIRVMDDRFAESDISHLNFAGGQNAIRYYESRKEAGTLPVAVKRESKPRTPALPPASTGGPGMATASRSRCRR